MVLLVLFAILLGFVGIGIPILLAIGLVGAGGMYFIDGINFALFPQRIFAMLDSFSLLALPYFVLAGALMAKGGLAQALVNFGMACVGHYRGSLAHTAIVSCTAMANVSGSSTAEAAAIGGIIIPAMKDKGYQPGLAAAIVGSAATIGPIIPPSMTMIVYGAMTGVSIGGLFIGGILPGLLLAIMMMVMVRLLAFLPNYPELDHREPKASFSQLLKAAREAWVALLAPVIILGGIFSGVFTATEAGVVASLYSFLVSVLVYKELKLKDMPRVILEAAVTTATVVGIISMAGALGWLLAYLNFNQLVLATLSTLSDNATVILIALLATVIVLTMFLESLAVLIVFVPIAAYVAQNFGFDQIHVGVLMVIATQIGATTPPVAVLMFVTTSIAGARFIDTCKHAVPFIGTLLGFLLVLVLIPSIVMFLPNLLM